MPDPLAITAAGAWAWDKFGQSLTEKAAGAAREGWKKFRWKKASADYRAKIKKLYGTMQIMGMAEPTPLDDIFTEAYLLDKPTAFSRFDIERLKQASADPDAPPLNARRVGGLALVESNKNLFILGKPGAGKTTFLKYITVQAAAPEKPVIDKVPIFVSLKRWADSEKELLPFIEEQFDNCDFPEARPFVEELLKTGGAIALFDGLDEVNQEGAQRGRQTRAMNNFIEKYDRTQCLITCRIAASDYSFKPFAYVEIADFTEIQVENFVGNWFRRGGGKDGETCRRFLEELREWDNRGLRDLARTPLLLTLLCLAFEETRAFPRRRATLYKEALDALLRKWDSSRGVRRDEVYRKLSLGDKVNMLTRIAAETFEKNEYFIPQPELERRIADYVRKVPPCDAEWVDAEGILKAIEAQHGILVERAREVYSFSHLTFQEYFTAKYVVDNAAKGTLTGLVQEHCADRRWYEVFLLTASMLPDAGLFMRNFRRSVDDLLGGDEKLGALLVWANNKSARYRRPHDARRRSDMMWVECYLSMGAGLGGGDDEYAFPFEAALDGDEEFDFDHDVLRILYAASARRRDPGGINNFSDIARRLGWDELASGLAALRVPTGKAAAEWRAFECKVRGLLIRHRDIGHEWNLTKVERERLFNYLKATKLLEYCLELAPMPSDEKKAILNSLYLPPG